MRQASLIIIIIVLLCYPLFAREDVTTLLIPPFKHTWGIHKGTRTKLKLLLGRDMDFDNPQGLAIVKLKSLDDPENKKDDDEVTAYGVNSGRGEIIYNESMYDLAVYGKKGSGRGEFLNPHGITADPDGYVYVADTDNRRIVKLFNPGKKLRFIKTFGKDSLREPFDLCITPKNELFITDMEMDCIFFYDSAGNCLDKIGKEILHSPRGIAVSSEDERYGYYRKNFIAVIDNNGKRVLKFNFKGIVLAEINHTQLGLKDADFTYVALDFYDNVYVTDKLNCQVHKFNPDLEYITTFGKKGDDDNEFDEPRGIAIWRRFGQIVIAEKASAQYYWVGLDLRDLKTTHNIGNNEITIEYFVTERAYLNVYIKDKDGDIVSTLVSKRRRKIGQNKDTFPIVDRRGNPLPPGEYTLEIMVEPTYSSYTHFDKKIRTNFVIPVPEPLQE